MKKEKFIAAALSQVDKGIYVWGGNGQDLLSMSNPIKWIRRKEGLTDNANRAIKLFEHRMAHGVNPIRAFDCSGLVYWAQKEANVGYTRKSANGYYKSCIAALALQPSDLVFHYDGKKCTHVGIYVGDDTVVESKGRDVGVVKTKYSTRKAYWNKQGRLKKIADETPSVTLLGDANCDGKVTAADAALILRYLQGLSDLTEQGKLNADYNQDGKITKEDAELIMQHIVGLKNVKVIGGSVYVRSVDYVPADKKENKASILGVAHKGDTFPYRATAPSGWYEIDYKGKVGYISNREDLTKLI